MRLNKQNKKSLDSIIVLVLKILFASLVNGGGYSYYTICQREPELGDKGIQCSPGINEHNGVVLMVTHGETASCFTKICKVSRINQFSLLCIKDRKC